MLQQPIAEVLPRAFPMALKNRMASPPRCVSPAVAFTSKTPSSISKSETSKVPPPMSYTKTSAPTTPRPYLWPTCCAVRTFESRP